MNPADEGLRQALRDLAAASPHGAPAEVGDRVRAAYARHHARRRQRRIAIGGLAACVMVLLAWLGASRQSHRSPVTAKALPAVQPSIAVPVASTVAAQKSSSATKKGAAAVKLRAAKSTRPRRPASESSATAMADADFVALPSFDPEIPIGPSRVVRVELPGSDLQLVGYPVSGELLHRHVVTDLLVGQDGVPYAVRLVSSH